MPFSVTVAKTSVPDAVLSFDCIAGESGGLRIYRVAVDKEDTSLEDLHDDDDNDNDDNDDNASGLDDTDNDDEPNDDAPSALNVANYQGPSFDDLDEGLQEEFVNFLEVRPSAVAGVGVAHGSLVTCMST